MDEWEDVLATATANMGGGAMRTVCDDCYLSGWIVRNAKAIEAGLLLSQAARGTIEGALRWHTALVEDGTPRWEGRWWTQGKYSPRFHSTDVFATPLEALRALDEERQDE